MAAQTACELADTVQDALLGVPGVVRLYRSGATAAKLLQAGAELVGLRDGESSLVTVREQDGSWRVTAALGVDADHEAGTVCRAAHAAAAEALAGRGADGAQLRLTVVHLIES